MNTSSYKLRSRWVALSLSAITVLSLMPQLRFWLARGSEWKGSYVALQPDEIVYSAYLSALIAGRPRRTDPSTGQDDHPQSPLPESILSIQFIPPVIIAWFARAFGATASSAFIALLGISGLLTGLSLLWLFNSITDNSKFSAVAILVVLCLGGVAGGQGLFGLFLRPDVHFLGLPFLRRYEPAALLPMLFVFFTTVWRALVATSKRSAVLMALLAGAIVAVLVFSYFYLWTAAAAWGVCVAVLWLVLRTDDRPRMVQLLGIAAAPATLGLAVYAYLLSTLPEVVDKAQILVFTRRPDLLRPPEIIGAFVLVALLIHSRRNKISVRSPSFIFAASFALLPFLVFNQQVLTGRSLQPFHYEVLVVNYAVVIGVIIAVRLMHAKIARRAAWLIVILCLVWATIEINLPFQARYTGYVEIDEMVPVLLRLKEQAVHDGTWEGLRSTGKAPGLVFSPQYGISQVLPVWAPQGSLLAPGSESFQGLSDAERKERLFTHFYYCGKDHDYLRELLSDRTSELFMAMRSKSIIFGTDRVSLVVGWEFQPIRTDEIEREVRAYRVFASSFTQKQAGKYPLLYVITRADDKFDFSRIGQWYERDAGVQIGRYILYRLTAKALPYSAFSSCSELVAGECDSVKVIG